MAGRILLSPVAFKTRRSTQGRADGSRKIAEVRLRLGAGGGTGIQFWPRAHSIGCARAGLATFAAQRRGPHGKGLLIGGAEPDWRSAEDFRRGYCRGWRAR